MALQKQPVELLFGQGIDTKSDPKTLPAGALLTLENGVLKKKSRIDKRNGYTKLGASLIDGSAVPTGDNLATFKDELLLYANQNLYSYSKATDRWSDKGACVSAVVTTDQVVKNTYAQTQVDSAELDGVAVFAYADSSGGIRATVKDSETGAVILANVLLDVAASRVRVLAFQNYIHVFYYKLVGLVGTLFVQRISVSAPSVFGSAVTILTDINTANPQYDVISYANQRILIAYNFQTSNGVRLLYIDVAGAVYSATFPAVTLATGATNQAVAVVLGDKNAIFVSYYNATDIFSSVILNVGFTVLRAAFQLNGTVGLVVNITGFPKADLTGVDFFYEHDTTGATYNRVVSKATAPFVGSVFGDAVFMRSVGLASKAFVVGGRGFVGVVHDSAFQATFFVARDDGLIVAKQKYGVAGGVTTVPILPAISAISATKFRYAIITKGDLVSENATLYTINGVSVTEVDFSAQGVFTSAELGNNLLICGGALQNYDGQGVTEHGFHLFPENFTATPGTAGSMATGAYYYVVVYEWTDNQGQLHRSAPSIPSAVQNVTGPNGSVALVIPTLRLTSKKGTRTPVSIAVYRTEASGTIYYRVTSVTSPLLNNPAADSVNYTDTTQTINSNELLYTTGGVLENFSPGSCSTIAVFKNRILLGGLENKYEILYSKLVTSGQPVEFAQELALLADEKGERVTAIGILDEKMVFFKKDRFYISYGDGPDNTGANGSFAPPEFVSSDVGCIDVQSIAQIPGAITFKSAKGIYVLNSGLQVEYFGAPVEDFNGATVTSAVMKADVNQVRFTTADNVCLVYDYFFRQWSTFTNHKGKDAVIWDQRYVYVRDDGAVLIETDGVFKDDGAPYHLKLGTSWLSLAGINGFQRAYRFGLLGEYKTPHLLSVKAGYDFSSSLESVMIFNSDEALGITSFGEGSPFGSDSPFGGDNISYRIRGHLPRQKCQSIRFEIEELTTSASVGTGEALTLSGMTVLVGLKASIAKLKSAQSLG